MKNIRFVDFDWKESDETGKHVQCGVIAQELETVESELVYQPKDSEGVLGLKHINSMHFSTISAKAIQELITEVETLKAKVATLEGS